MESFEIIWGLLLVVFSLVVGEYLGYKRGISQARDVRQEETGEELRGIIDQLTTEVEDNEDLLSQDFTRDRFGNRMYLSIIFRDGYDNVLQLGAYKNLSPDLMTNLKYYYSAVGRWNELVRMYAGEEVALKLQHLFNTQTNLLNNLLKASKDMQVMLTQELANPTR
jgi:hypothetical protein